MAIYLVKYMPLVATAEGEAASARFIIPPYVDGSCRREPDFESKSPSISALCRAELFAPHLKENDEVLYITVKGDYGQTFRHWKIVAHLKAFKRFASHSDAAKWYRGKGMKLPSNCMVPGNPPLPLDQTLRGSAKCAPGCGSAAATLKEWNEHYQKRANSFPVFLACRHVRKPELQTPATLTDSAAIRILKDWGRINSRRPIPISQAELNAIERIATSQKRRAPNKV